MVTCKSPLKVLKYAYELGRQCLPDYGSEFSRQDFTRPQLFACLVLREHQKKSYRGVVALLEDSPGWREAIGLSRTPDHRTLCRAFGEWFKPGLAGRMMDRLAAEADRKGLIRADAVKPMAMDSTMFESRHVSRHFEKRCRQTAAASKKSRENGGKTRPTPPDAG